MIPDAELLHRFAETHAEDAFAELVRRHVNLVYSVALRQVGGDRHLAEDVAQSVFAALARKAVEVARRDSIGGWLYRSTHFAASDVVRSERRRQARTKEVCNMREVLGPPEPSLDVDKLRPLLDAAIAQLSEADRSAVWSRYFEGRSYGDIGQRLELTENAARMRVERALEKLRGILARRGIASTIAAIAVALPGQAATVAPAGLAAALAHTAVVASATGAGGVAVGGALWHAVSATKIALGTAALITSVAVGTALYHARESDQARARTAAALDAYAAVKVRMAALEKEVATLTQTAAAAEADAETLLSAVTTASSRTARATPSGAGLTPEAVTARFRQAQELANGNQMAEALADYLWCFDIGMPQFASLADLRQHALLDSLAELGRRFPAALEALRTRRDSAERRLADSDDTGAAPDFVAINRTLAERDRSMQLHDALPAENPVRATLAPLLHGQLADARRYQEAARARPFYRAVAEFELGVNGPAPDSRSGDLAVASETPWDLLLQTAARDVEVFAGAGQPDYAAQLALRVFEYDRSPPTVARLQQSAARAGRPDIIYALIK